MLLHEEKYQTFLLQYGGTWLWLFFIFLAPFEGAIRTRKAIKVFGKDIAMLERAKIRRRGKLKWTKKNNANG